ncbi:hypothetical protein JTB14_017546 [Gonioctena quinquepunctata]|nr:hypothetical protein JTB14_017546 [Gonioctena quinquepunctata]
MHRMDSCTKMNILQENLGRTWAAHDLVFVVADEKDNDSIRVIKPDKKIDSKSKWIEDNRKNLGIFCRHENIGIESYVYSPYFSE